MKPDRRTVSDFYKPFPKVVRVLRANLLLAKTPYMADLSAGLNECWFKPEGKAPI